MGEGDAELPLGREEASAGSGGSAGSGRALGRGTGVRASCPPLRRRRWGRLTLRGAGPRGGSFFVPGSSCRGLTLGSNPSNWEQKSLLPQGTWRRIIASARIPVIVGCWLKDGLSNFVIFKMKLSFVRLGIVLRSARLFSPAVPTKTQPLALSLLWPEGGCLRCARQNLAREADTALEASDRGGNREEGYASAGRAGGGAQREAGVRTFPRAQRLPRHQDARGGLAGSRGPAVPAGVLKMWLPQGGAGTLSYLWGRWAHSCWSWYCCSWWYHLLQKMSLLLPTFSPLRGLSSLAIEERMWQNGQGSGMGHSNPVSQTSPAVLGSVGSPCGGLVARNGASQSKGQPAPAHVCGGPSTKQCTALEFGLSSAAICSLLHILLPLRRTELPHSISYQGQLGEGKFGEEMFILILRWNQVFSLSAAILLSTGYSCSPASLFHSSRS